MEMFYFVELTAIIVDIFPWCYVQWKQNPWELSLLDSQKSTLVESCFLFKARYFS